MSSSSRLGATNGSESEKDGGLAYKGFSSSMRLEIDQLSEVKQRTMRAESGQITGWPIEQVGRLSKSSQSVGSVDITIDS